MKKIVLLLVVMVGLCNIHAQSKKVMRMLDQIEGEWKLNKKGVPEYIKIFDNLSTTKKQLFKNTIAYFNYDSLHDIEILEKDGDYNQVKIKYQKKAEDSCFLGACIDIIPVYYGIIEFKENKMRLKLALSKWLLITLPNSPHEEINYKNITETYPLDKNAVAQYAGKNDYGKAFYNAHKNITQIIDQLGNNIINYKEDTSSESSDW